MSMVQCYTYFYIFPPFSLIGQKGQSERSKGTQWKQQWWYQIGQHSIYSHRQWTCKKTNTTSYPAITKKFDVTTQADAVAPITQEATANGYSYKSNTILFKILEAPLRISTHNKYNSYIKQWWSYSTNMHHIEVTHILDFLGAMFDKGCAYLTINSAKFAIATIVNILLYSSINKEIYNILIIY